MPCLLTIRVNKGVGAPVGDNDVQRVVVRVRHGYVLSWTNSKLVKPVDTLKVGTEEALISVSQTLSEQFNKARVVCTISHIMGFMQA